MHKVTFLPDNVTFESRDGECLLDVGLKNWLDIPHNCGGVCACSTCHVIVKEGMENLSEMEDKESDQLDEAEGLTLNSRLSCQARVYGNVVVELPQMNDTLKPLFHEGKIKE